MVRDSLLEDGDTIDLGPAGHWGVIHTPGHAPGHICLIHDAVSNAGSIGAMTTSAIVLTVLLRKDAIDRASSGS